MLNPIAWFYNVIGNDDYWNLIELLHVFGSLASFLFLPIEQLFPSGMFLNAKTRLKYHTLHPRAGIFLIHFPALVLNILFYIQLQESELLSIPSICFLVLLVYRSLIYPWFRRSYASRIPFRTVMFQLIISCSFSLTYARMISFSSMDLHLAIQVVLCSAIGILFLIMVACDWIVCRSRKPTPDDYVVNTRFLFKYVTCPQYGAQCGIYILLACFCRDIKGFVSIAIWLVIVFMKRADNVRLWMCVKFAGYSRKVKYPCFPLLVRTPGIL